MFENLLYSELLRKIYNNQFWFIFVRKKSAEIWWIIFKNYLTFPSFVTSLLESIFRKHLFVECYKVCCFFFLQIRKCPFLWRLATSGQQLLYCASGWSYSTAFKPCLLFFIKLFFLYFFQIYIYFSPNDSTSKTIKNVFLFHLKSSFRSQNINIFVFLSSPLFLPVSHCLRGCFKINLKVYDVINYLNNNLITHFVWYPEKEKRYDIETLFIERVLYKEHYLGKIIQKMPTKS